MDGDIDHMSAPNHSEGPTIQSDLWSVLQSYSVPLISGICTGIIFAYFGKDIEEVSAILTTLVTVQGSFLAIVVSVFLLSSQVTASEYNPFTLEEIEDQSAVDGIITLFIFSILIDFLYVLAQYEPIIIVPTDLNLTLGITVGLATICFLSVLPAKRSMSESVDPERILKRAYEGIGWESVNQSVQMQTDTIEEEMSPPNRSPLVVIEQILHSSDERNDEFTLRQSIFYMYKSIRKLIAEEPVNSERDYDIIFGHWQRCIEVGKQGDKARVVLLGKAHSRIIGCLISSSNTGSLNERLKELEGIQLCAFEKGSYQPELLSWYKQFVTQSLESGNHNEIESILTSLTSMSIKVTERNKSGQVVTPDLSGERRSIVSACFSDSVDCLVIVGEHTNGNQMLLRRISQNTISNIDDAFGEIRSRIKDSEIKESKKKSVEQNILSATRDSCLDAIRSLAEIDTQTSINLTKVVIEITIHQGNSPRQLWAEMTGEDRDKKMLEIMTFAAQSLKYKGYVSAFSSLEEVTESEVTAFADELEALIEAEQSDVS